MKSIYSLLLFFSFNLHARDVVLVENMGDKQTGSMVKEILLKKFHIPEDLITIKNNRSACTETSESIAHFCLTKEGDLKVVKMNMFVVKNSLGVFLDSEEEK